MFSVYPAVLINFLPFMAPSAWEKQNQSAPHTVLMQFTPPYLLQSTIIKSPNHPSLSSTTSSPHPNPGQKIAPPILAMRPLPLLLLPLLLIAIHSPPRALAALEGGWQPIKDISDPHVQEIAEFAVSEHNRQANTRLALSKVVKGETQVVSGINYRLVLETKDGEAMANYVAVVWEKAWEKFRELTSFTAVKS